MDNLRQLQLAELELLKSLVKLLDENAIPYFSLGGTLLGSIRHKGFIPWDDDVDIGIPRPYYDRLPELIKDSEHLKLVWPDGENCYYYISRLVNDKIRIKRTGYAEEQPAWIDIFPLDGMPSGEFRQKLHKLNVLKNRYLFNLSKYASDKTPDVWKNKSKKKYMLVKTFCTLGLPKLMNPKRAFNRLDRTLKRFSYDKSEFFYNGMGAYKFREMFNKSCYGEGCLYPFEDMLLRGPEDYDFVLTQLYGDWKTPPSNDSIERNHHVIESVSIDE